jgi:hypothetical protein
VSVELRTHWRVADGDWVVWARGAALTQPRLPRASLIHLQAYPESGSFSPHGSRGPSSTIEVSFSAGIADKALDGAPHGNFTLSPSGERLKRLRLKPRTCDDHQKQNSLLSRLSFWGRDNGGLPILGHPCSSGDLSRRRGGGGCKAARCVSS